MQVTLTRDTARKLFAHLLRRARESAPTPPTGAQIAAQLRISTTAYVHYETGERRPDHAKLALVLDALDCPDRLEVMSDILQIARRGTEQGLHTVGLADRVELYLALEGYACGIQAYDPLVVHGLLQTPDYTRSLYRRAHELMPESDVDTMLAVRAGRRAALTRDNPARLTAFLDQRALHTQVGGPEVMAGQLRSLLADADLPHVEILVVPDLAAHPTGGRDLALLRFTDRWRVGYAQTPLTAYYYDSAAEIGKCAELLAHLRHASLDAAESRTLIASALATLTTATDTGREDTTP